MKSHTFIFILWFFSLEALYEVLAYRAKDFSEMTLNDTQAEKNDLFSTIVKLETLVLEKDKHSKARDDQFIKYIDQQSEIIKNKEENFKLKNQEITKRLENLAEMITNCRIESARKDSQIQDKTIQLQTKDTQLNQTNNDLRDKLNNQEIIELGLKNLTEVITNYRIEAEQKDGQIQVKNEQLKAKDTQIKSKTDEIKDLREQIKNKLKNEEIIENRLKNMIEDITNYRIEAARKDYQIQNNNEQLKTKDTQLNQRNDEIKDLIAQIKSTQEELISLRYQTQSISEKLNSTKDQLAKYTYTEQCPSSDKGTYFLFKIRGINTFESWCSIDGWMVIQNRKNGHQSFNRTWNDYKEGFGDLATEFFFGLEKLHLMTEAGTYALYIYLEDINGTSSYAQYSDFKIGSEKESYYLKSLGEYSGTAGPSLNRHIQAKFSTFDKDTSDCVNNHGGGWWYKSCGTSSLNGNYFKNGISGGVNNYGIYWEDFRDPKLISLTFTRMMIKPTSL